MTFERNESLTYLFGMMVHLDRVKVKFGGQGYRSRVKVTFIGHWLSKVHAHTHRWIKLTGENETRFETVNN